MGLGPAGSISPLISRKDSKPCSAPCADSVYGVASISRTFSRTRRNSTDGAKQKVRYVSRKGSQRPRPPDIITHQMPTAREYNDMRKGTWVGDLGIEIVSVEPGRLIGAVTVRKELLSQRFSARRMHRHLGR